MRVLRLGNSEDSSPGVEDHERAWVVAAKELERVSDEPVETVVRAIFPSQELPGLLRKWIAETDPDLVFLKVTWYWYAYESVPRRIERIFGRVGKPFATAGLKAASRPAVAHNRPFRFGRRLAHRIIGGDTQVPTTQVVSVIEECIRSVLARENVLLVVKGTGDARAEDEGLQGYFGRFTRRRLEVEGAIERLCHELHVPYTGTRRAGKVNPDLKGDGIHRGGMGQTRMGLNEGAAMAEAWLAFGGQHSSSAPTAASTAQA